MPLVKQLANWIKEFGADEIPPEVVRQASLLILESVGRAVLL